MYIPVFFNGELWGRLVSTVHSHFKGKEFIVIQDQITWSKDDGNEMGGCLFNGVEFRMKRWHPFGEQCAYDCFVDVIND